MAENEKLNNVAVDNDVGTMEDVDAIMKKYDRESNTRVWEGTPRKILRVLTALFGIFLIVMNMWIKMDERARRPLFLGLVIILVFIYYPIKKGSQKLGNGPAAKITEGQLHALVRYRHGGSRRVLFLLLPLKS